METKILEPNSDIKNLNLFRLLDQDNWIENYGSSTLKRAKKLGASFKNLYLEERIAWEWGLNFKGVPKSRITFGDPYTEGDCHFITEGQWIADRYIIRSPFLEDLFEWKYIIVSDTNSNKLEEGLGLILRETTAQFIPSGYIIYAIIVTVENHKYTSVNPI